MIDIRQLRYAVLTAETHSFSRAAQLLNTKQSSLSRRILALEDRLGIQLFERSTRGTIPTEHGKAFLNVARRIITDIDNLQTTARAVSYGEEGRFSLGFASSLMVGNLLMAITDYMGRYPDVQFDGTEGGAELLLSGLQARIIDAIVFPTGLNDAGIKQRRLWPERLLVVLPHDHELARRETLLWTDLRDEYFVLSATGIGPTIGGILTAKLLSQGFQRNVVVQNTGLEAILSTVSIGRYVTIATEASLGVTWPKLVFREIMDQGGPARLDYSLYWREDNENPALKRFHTLLEERYPG
ncbi:MAG: LysR family transcriptional regulator [Sphingopyxis sp.]|nr:LysR family transcriptional regulator [Sphingopyxis sp.]